MSSLACSEEHSAEEKEHGQRMVQRVQLHMHEGTLGRYRKGGRGSSQEPENVPRSRTGQLVELSTVRTPTPSVYTMVNMCMTHSPPNRK